jgi:hypothetical protein
LTLPRRAHYDFPRSHPGSKSSQAMVQRPSAISLMLCDQVVFERETQKPYLLGVFTGVSADHIPTPPQRFDIFAALTDGLGDVRMTLTVEHLDTNQEIYSQHVTVRFSDPFQVVNVRFRIRHLVYPAAGTYLFALIANDEELATRRIRVYEVGESP